MFSSGRPSRLNASTLTLLTLVAAFSASPAFASALRWDHTELSIDAAPLAESVEGVFTFTNTGSEATTIAGVHSSCGCTVPELKKNTYAPGESGTIRAVFTLGERTGMQEKTITVMTAAPDSTQTILTLRVDIPKLFEVSPYFVVWNAGEPPSAKKIRLHVLVPDLLKIQTVESRHENFVASIEPSADGSGNYTVSVTPKSTEEVSNGAVHVVLVTPNQQTKRINLYGLVRAGPKPAASSSSTTAANSSPRSAKP